ncbi:tetratricopeptide repeat protein [Sulfurirhabdus autotrophica]|nr:hypothetical protein [Sulfurirhabdus autotrophica]
MAFLSLLLSGCAVQPNKTAQENATSLKTAISEANEAYQAGQADKALVMFKTTANSFPADKTPWVRIAQIKFDSGNYGDAIVNALEALQRDPNDKIANSIVAVSSLRLSTKSLSVLRSQNDLTGSLKTEAQDLAKVLRESLGETVLVPSQEKPVMKTVAKVRSASHSTRRASKSAPVSKPEANDTKEDSRSSNPFGALK